MKAAQINEYGDTSVILINSIDVPTPTEGQVLIEVHSTSLNPFDTTIREGHMKEVIPLQFPVTLGGDIAGIVTGIGSGVTGIKERDCVYGQANVVAGNSGAFAEYAVTSAQQITKMPKNMDFNQAASLPLVGVSAIQALEEHIKLKPKQKIFIHGGAGGIGSIAIQIARYLGAYIATTATGDNTDYVRKLGADEVINYKMQNFADALNDYDAVFDTVGGDDFAASLKILKRGGVAVSMIAKADESEAKSLGINALMQSTHVTTGALDRLRRLAENGVITPQVNKMFPLAEIKEAFVAREQGSGRGKIIVTVKNNA